jgi:hypothetical protein
VWGPRAAPPGEYGLSSGENGDLARANGANDGPYCSPACPNACRRQCKPLGWSVDGVGGGGWSCTSAATRGRGALLPFEWLTKKNAQGPGLWELLPKARAGWLSYVHWSREGQEEKFRCFATAHRPCRVHWKKTIAVLVIQPGGNRNTGTARPPALTPSRRYRRSLVSKGRFAAYPSTRPAWESVQALRKAISRGDILCRRHSRPATAAAAGGAAAGCFVGHDTCAIWENRELPVGFHGCWE